MLSIIGDIDNEFDKYKAENEKLLSAFFIIFKDTNESFFRLSISRKDLSSRKDILSKKERNITSFNTVGCFTLLNSEDINQNIELKEIPDDFELKQNEIWEKVLRNNWYLYNLKSICINYENNIQISNLQHPENQKFNNSKFNNYLIYWFTSFIKSPETAIDKLNEGISLYNKYLKKSLFLEKEKSSKLKRGRQVPKGKTNEDLKNHFVKVLFHVKEFPTNNQLSDENILGQSGWKHKMNNQDFVSELSLFLIKVKKSKKYTINSEREELLNKTMEDLSKKLIRLQQIETNYKTKEHKDFNNSEKGARESDY